MRMKHKQHGFLTVDDKGHAERLRVHGWVDEDEHYPGEEPPAECENCLAMIEKYNKWAADKEDAHAAEIADKDAEIVGLKESLRLALENCQRKPGRLKK